MAENLKTLFEDWDRKTKEAAGPAAEVRLSFEGLVKLLAAHGITAEMITGDLAPEDRWKIVKTLSAVLKNQKPQQ